MAREIAEYNHQKRITNPELFKQVHERMDNPNVITGKEGVYYLFKMMGIPINIDEIFSE